MKATRAGWTVAAITTMAAAVIIPTVWFHSAAEERLERRRFDAEETELSVSNPASARLRLLRSGNALAGAAAIEDFNGSSRWLPPGNYFLEAALAGKAAYYPVNLTGYRSGPDHGGSYGVTVRTPPAAAPPNPTGSSPPFAFIPNGSFLMGNRLNPQEPHSVWLTGFYIAIFETTNDEYRAFVDDPAGYGNDACWSSAGRSWKAAHVSRATALLKPEDPEYRRFGRPDQPVVQVNWYEANAYCRWLTAKLGGRRWQFSLPNEAEWEKAARGPDGFDYALGNTISDAELGLYNWKKNPSAEVTVIGYRDSMKSTVPNRYGLLHMTGNASEWTLSAFRPISRQKPYQEDDRNQEGRSEMRVVRGGSWYSASIASLSIPYRESFPAEVANPYLGFRIVARILD